MSPEGLNLTSETPLGDQINKEKQKVDTTRSALRNSTRPDGTVNMPLFEAQLRDAGISMAELPPEMSQNVPAVVMESVLDQYETTLDSAADVIITRAELVNFLAPLMEDTLNVTETYKIIAVVDEPKGKWASTYGNVVAIDSRYIAPMLMKRFFNVVNTTSQTGNSVLDQALLRAVNNPEVQANVLNSSYSFDINQYALQVNILLNDRIDIYDSQSSMKEELITDSNEIYGRLGLNHPSTISATLSSTLETFYLFQDFLNNVFAEAMFLLIILSILLIYSLMNSNIEDKNYEFGMLRVLGMRQSSLIVLLSLQSMFFALPGLTLGFLVAYALNMIVSYCVFESTMLPTSYILDSRAIGIGLGIGIAIPLVSNLWPIRKALSKTLRDFLNIYQRATSDVILKMMKFNQIGISFTTTLASVLLIVLGFLTFYLAPYAYAFSNMGLFFGILNGVLMLMILGLAFLAILLQGPLERFVLWVITWAFWRNRKLRVIIKKNFDGHKKKNRKTSLMFILALAFLIFSGTGFKINSDMLIDQIKSTLGSDLVIQALPYETTFLNETDIRSELEKFRETFPSVIRDYAFVSQPFSLQKQVSDIEYSSLTATPLLDVDIVGVDSSYLRSVYESLYVPDEYDSAVSLEKIPDSDHLDGVEGLYEEEGLTTQGFDPESIITKQDFSQLFLEQFVGSKEVRFIIPKALSRMASTKVGSSSMITIGSLRFRGRVRNIATKVPGFSFTGYKNPSTTNTILTSHEDFRYMRDVVWQLRGQVPRQRAEIEGYNATIPENSSYGIPKLGLLVRLEKDVDRNTRQKLFNYLEVLVQGKFTVTTNVVEIVDLLDSLLNYIDVFFILVSIIAIFLSFFFTVVAFTANVTENLWEFGVLRAVGLNKKQMCLTYIFEALSIIIAAGILGTAVGIIVSLMTSIQFNIYTELPFRFVFPSTVFIVAIGASLLTAVIGSKYAVDSVKNKQIATIIKALG